MKRIITFSIILSLALGTLAGCSSGSSQTDKNVPFVPGIAPVQTAADSRVNVRSAEWANIE